MAAASSCFVVDAAHKNLMAAKSAKLPAFCVGNALRASLKMTWP